MRIWFDTTDSIIVHRSIVNATEAGVTDDEVIARVLARGWTLYIAYDQYLVVKAESQEIVRIIPPEPSPPPDPMGLDQD